MAEIGFLWFVLAIAVALLANKRGRSAFGWFVIALLFSPLVGFVFLLVLDDLSASTGSSAGVPSGATHVKCPACAEWVMPEATVCKHCGHALEPDADFYVRKANFKASYKPKKEPWDGFQWAAVIFVGLLAVGTLARCVN
jgi:hypothetical protein